MRLEARQERFLAALDINCGSSISSVVFTENYVLAGLLGEESNVKAYSYRNLNKYEFNGVTPRYILENNHGGVSRLVLSPCRNILMGLTCYGWIYIWNIEILRVDMEEEVGETAMIKPERVFNNGHPGDSICAEFLNSEVIIAAGISPGSSFSLISVKTGRRIGQYVSRKSELMGLAWPMYHQMDEREIKEADFELAVYAFTSIAIDRSSSSGGCWVALGGSNGLIALIYLPSVTISKVERLDEIANLENEDINLSESDFLWKCQQISELSTEIRSVAWRPRSGSNAGLCLVCGTNDSLLRYCFIEVENKTIHAKKINLVKITDGTSTSSEINSISFPSDGSNNSMVAVGFNRFYSAKKHPIFATSENLSKKTQSFSSFKVYVQDTVEPGNSSNNLPPQTYFYSPGGHNDIITEVKISPCNRYIASSSVDGHLHIYNKSRTNESNKTAN
ncbi:WD40 repeat containing protein [Cryptosporidium felis]|nr:WD40 repeat containing protein [Cryptosporidium felis]